VTPPAPFVLPHVLRSDRNRNSVQSRGNAIRKGVDRSRMGGFPEAPAAPMLRCDAPTGGRLENDGGIMSESSQTGAPPEDVEDSTRGFSWPGQVCRMQCLGLSTAAASLVKRVRAAVAGATALETRSPRDCPDGDEAGADARDEPDFSFPRIEGKTRTRREGSRCDQSGSAHRSLLPVAVWSVRL
jgi:hypothetical protein